MRAWRRTRSHRGLAAALLAAGLLTTALAAAVVPAAPAQAHATLVDTSPVNGTRLDTAPEQIRLRFNERVSVSADGVRLRTGDGVEMPTETARVDPAAITDVVLPMPPELPPDTYVVSFRVVSADSHPVTGALVFSVGVPVTPVADLAPSGDDPALVTIFAVARWAGYAGLALLTGALLVLVLCWPAGWQQARASRLLRIGWAVSLLSAAAVLLLQGGYAAGRGLSAVTDPGLLAQTMRTDYGHYLVARLALLAAAGVLLLPQAARRPRLRSAAAPAVAVALPLTWLGTGHRNTGGPLDLLVDTAHLLAMAGWFGGLVLLAVCLLPRSARRPATEVAPALRRFSLLASGSVVTLLVTGVYLAWREVGSVAALTGTAYGRLLAFKLAAIGLLLWFGALSWTVVRRRYPTPPDGGGGVEATNRTRRRATRSAAQAEGDSRAQLRQSVRLEVATAGAVLAVVAVLVATPPGVVVTAEAAAPAARRPILVSEPLGENPVEAVRVLVDPARPGDNRVVVSVWDAAGELWDVPEVRAAFVLPAAGRGPAAAELGPLPLELARLGPGEYDAMATLPTTGIWRLDLAIRTTEIDSTTVRLEIPIS